MKKIIAITFVGMFGLMTFGSCVKEYQCECTYNSGSTNPNSVNVSTTSVYPLKGTKEDVKKKCENSTNYSLQSACKIK